MNYDICSGRPKKDGSTYWHKIGVMFPSERGGFSIKLDSLPVANAEGEVWVKAFEQKPRDEAPRQAETRRDWPREEIHAYSGDKDDIPF